MRFVADEGVDGAIVKSLRKNGHDVIFIAEFARGSHFHVVLEIAVTGNRILITRDKDFGELVYRDNLVHSGIILNRLYQLSSDKKALIVSNVIENYQDRLNDAFTVIHPDKDRIRGSRYS